MKKSTLRILLFSTSLVASSLYTEASAQIISVLAVPDKWKSDTRKVDKTGGAKGGQPESAGVATSYEQ